MGDPPELKIELKEPLNVVRNQTVSFKVRKINDSLHGVPKKRNLSRWVLINGLNGVNRSLTSSGAKV